MAKIRRKLITGQARQGDVLICAIDAPPKGAVEKPSDAGRTVLAYGEVTGHAHAFRDPGVCCLRAEGAALDILRVTEGIVGLLEHEEHDHLRIAPGTYEVRLQREWDYLAEMARTVAD